MKTEIDALRAVQISLEKQTGDLEKMLKRLAADIAEAERLVQKIDRQVMERGNYGNYYKLNWAPSRKTDA